MLLLHIIICDAIKNGFIIFDPPFKRTDIFFFLHFFFRKFNFYIGVFLYNHIWVKYFKKIISKNF